MSTSSQPQRTDFSLDVLGRFLCNGLDEALASTDRSQFPDARPFDVVVVGGGSFGAILAAHLFNNDQTHSHRVLVLEGGPFLLPEHVQNLPMMGITAPGPVTSDPGVPRESVWGIAWQSNVKAGFPGLAYCLGGRSVFWGGWSPQLLHAEMPTTATPQHPNAWPAGVVDDLEQPAPSGEPGYFRQAAEQIGTTATNDFIHGPLHKALRRQLFDGVQNGLVADAVPFAELPQLLDGVPAAKQDLFKLEAPLAVQGNPPRSGFFPINKFSTVPLLAAASRRAREESAQGFPSPDGADVRKRFMVVPNCRVVRLITDVTAGQATVTGVLTSQGFVPLPEHGVAVIALGTIESTRLALLSFGGIANYPLVGTNLMAHLRSNLVIRVPRSALAFLPASAKDLEQSALFLKGRHQHADGSVGHFHLQITASGGGGGLGTNSDVELFQKVPDIDLQRPFRAADLDHVVVTLRSIGETQPRNPKSRITLKLDAIDEVGVPRAFVELGDPREPEQPADSPQTRNDRDLWNAMEKATEEVAKVINGGTMPEVLSNGRDGMGTTHHEAGPLWMGADPTQSVSDQFGRLHCVDNAYVAGPALFPTVGSPNPMLTGTALARRTADRLLATLPHPVAPPPEPGFVYLFDGTEASFAQWQRAGTSYNSSTFLLADGAIVAYPAGEYSVLVYAPRGFSNFVLRLQVRLSAPDDNSGLFVRFRYPFKKWADLDGNPAVQANRARIAELTGFEVQIDDLARPDGADRHRTGALYNVETGGAAGQQQYVRPPALAAGVWHDFEVEVAGELYKVKLDGQPTTAFTNLDVLRARPASEDPFFGFLGVQSHSGLTAYRNIRIGRLEGARLRLGAREGTLRILHLTTEFPPVIFGGLGTAVGGLVHASARAGEKVGVLLIGGVLLGRGYGRAGDGPAVSRLGEETGDEGIDFFQIPPSAALGEAARIALQWGADLVHLHTAWVWPFVGAIVDSGIPLVYTVHSVDRAEYEIGREPGHILEHCEDQGRAVALADRLIALTHDEAELLDLYYPEARERVRIVGNGIADSETARRAARREHASAEPLVLYTGRLVERKGIRDLLAAIPRVLESAPEARFVLAGGPPGYPGAELARLWLPPECLPHTDRIHFTGWLSTDEVERWYDRADVQVIPSRYEPFGMVVLEGMLAGLPIVATGVGGPAAILDDGRTGLLVPPWDPQGLASALIRLLTDAELRRRLGTAAASEVRRNWLWSQAATRMREVYLEAVA